MSDLRLSLAQPITTRDGTLTKDSLMKNFTTEERDGVKLAIKRPGYSTIHTPTSPSPGQGLFNLRNAAYSINAGTIFRLLTGAGFPLAAPVDPNELLYIWSDIEENTSPFTVAVIKSAQAMWLFDGTIAVKVTDPDYPVDTVPGLVCLDGTFYVMDTKRNIYGSAIQDPSSWNPLNFIAADQGLGEGRGLFRHLNYVFAFCDNGIQAFYNNANPPPGSPLSPAGNATYLIGCPAGATVVSLDDLTIFVSKSKQRGRSVSALQGLSLVPLSTTYVDKILNRGVMIDTEITAFGIKIQGHSYYVLTLQAIQLTLVCDLVSKEWSTWTSLDNPLEPGVEREFPFRAYLNNEREVFNVSRDLLQYTADGRTVEMLPTLYQDNGFAIPGLIRTILYDGQTSLYKFFVELNVLGDQASTTVEIRYSDDDYQTWSQWRSVSMNNARKMLRNLGRSRRRAFEVRHTDNAPARLEGLDFEMYLGQS